MAMMQGYISIYQITKEKTRKDFLEPPGGMDDLFWQSGEGV